MSWSESQKRRRLAQAEKSKLQGTQIQKIIVVPKSFKVHLAPDLIKIILRFLPSRDLLLRVKRTCKQWQLLANDCVSQLTLGHNFFDNRGHPAKNNLNHIFPRLVDITLDTRKIDDNALSLYYKSWEWSFGTLFFPTLEHFHQIGGGDICAWLWRAVSESTNQTFLLHYEQCSPRLVSEQLIGRVATMEISLSWFSQLNPLEFSNIYSIKILSNKFTPHAPFHAFNCQQVGQALNNWTNSTLKHLNFASSGLVFDSKNNHLDQVSLLFGSWSKNITTLDIAVDFYLQEIESFIIKLREHLPALSTLTLVWTNKLKFPSVRGSKMLFAKFWNSVHLRVVIELAKDV